MLNEYVVFDPTQVKSATSNSGAFDPSNPSINLNRMPRRSGSADALRPTESTALVVETSLGPPSVALIDVNALEGVNSLADLEKRSSAILGFIKTDYPQSYDERITLACDNRDGSAPLQVSMSVAQKGWGPLLYDAALWAVAEESTYSEGISGYLMPDRNNVFSGARKVWKHYLEKRASDIQSRKIPKSCPHHGYPDPDPVIDRMYKAKTSRPAFREMGRMSTAWRMRAEQLEDLTEASREELEEVLVKMGTRFFGEKI